MSLRAQAAIVGIAELPTRRTYPGRTTVSLMAEVARLGWRSAQFAAWRLRISDTHALYAERVPLKTMACTIAAIVPISLTSVGSCRNALVSLRPCS